MSVNYVRFQRGSSAAYQALKETNNLNLNTLYFIYDKENSNTGSLYMGDKLISGGDVNFTSASLDELSDVIVSGAETNSFLVKDDNNNWIAKTSQEVAELIQEHILLSPVFTGDNLSIEIIDNTIQLKNFGSGYYKYIPAVRNKNTGEILKSSTYEYIENDFIDGLEPKVISNINGNLEIAWYEPFEKTSEEIYNEIEIINNAVESLDEILNSEDGLVDQIENIKLQNDIINNNISNIEENFQEEINDINQQLNQKVDINVVYNKEDTNKIIAEAIANADHLKRIVVESKEAIDINKKDALSYIYMVPTGLQYDDDKYDEYVVIEISEINTETNETIVIRKLEKVGSWEIDLTNYVKIDDLNKLNNEINNLSQIVNNIPETNLSEEISNKLNFITNIDNANFTVVDGQLQLNSSQGRLITNEEISTLQAIANGEFNNFIKSVNTEIFSVNEIGNLDLISIPSSTLEPIIGDMTELMNYKEGTTIVDELNNIQDILTWKNL